MTRSSTDIIEAPEAEPSTGTHVTEIGRRSHWNELAAIKFAQELRRAIAATGQAFSAADVLYSGLAVNQPAAVLQQVVCAPRQTSRILQALERLRTFSTWSDNWNAEGAPAPDGAAINAASNLLGFLKSYDIDPAAMLDAYGKPMFLFKYHGDEAEINVPSGDTIEFVFACGQENEIVEVEIPFDNASMPDTLDHALRKLVRAE